jgi:hypothetical protein
MFICYPTIYDITMLALVSYMKILIELKYPVYPDSILKRSLINGRIHFKFAVNRLQITTSSMGCVLFMSMHAYMRASGSAFAYLWTDSIQIGWAYTINDQKLHGLQTYHVRVRARVIKRSLIYGRILFKFAVNILQITTCSMGYVLFMTRVCDCMS